MSETALQLMTLTAIKSSLKLYMVCITLTFNMTKKTIVG